jgi:hypothetical protein
MAAPSLPPAGGVAPSQERSNVYRCIPHLGPARPSDVRPALLPQRGGWPGLVYLQCPLSVLRDAESSGWMRLHGAETYTIEGPAGTIDMVLLAQGRILPGVAPESGRQSCVIHRTVFEQTGLDPETGFPPGQDEALAEKLEARGLYTETTPCGKVFGKATRKNALSAVRMHTLSCKQEACREVAAQMRKAQQDETRAPSVAADDAGATA